VNESFLRPLERQIMKLSRQGQSPVEIGRRFRRSPGFITRIMAMSEMPRTTAPAPTGGAANPLRPIERRVLWWREQGAAYPDIASRFRRTPEFIRRVEDFARFKLTSG